MADDSSIGMIGVVVKRSQGVHGDVVLASSAALADSMSASPPFPSVNP
jgi:hypothetical protein